MADANVVEHTLRGKDQLRRPLNGGGASTSVALVAVVGRRGMIEACPAGSLVVLGSHALQAAAADPPQMLPAREQMAFTLGFHIILVPFGVAFTFMMLLANYRGIRKGDETAMLLARRWSQVAAVLFAVGAVSGTVLSFELGLLWPGLMGTYGAAFGIPFAIEGLFFFLEAIFVAIYIYGWNRMRPWPHFWTGVPVVLATSGCSSPPRSRST